MKRYQIVSWLKTTNRPMVMGDSEHPAEAFQIAKKLSERGVSEVKIGDPETGEMTELADFAAQHGLR